MTTRGEVRAPRRNVTFADDVTEFLMRADLLLAATDARPNGDPYPNDLQELR
jgi:hypothetical protein